MQKKFIIYLMVLGIFMIIGCDEEEPTKPSYTDLINEGWSSFTQGNYQAAFDNFAETKAMNETEAESYTGLGWSLMKLDNLSQASTEFNTGSTKSNVSADLHAGWAFVLNAQKEYMNSNTQTDEALSKDSNWSFSHGLSLNTDALHVLKAENYFALGEFSQSLAEVRMLNLSFDVDVTTSEGQAALAEEIERLKGIS